VAPPPPPLSLPTPKEKEGGPPLSRTPSLPASLPNPDGLNLPPPNEEGTEDEGGREGDPTWFLGMARFTSTILPSMRCWGRERHESTLASSSKTTKPNPRLEGRKEGRKGGREERVS